MQLDGLHLVMTYQCTLACDHCFLWGSPWQTGTMTAAQVDHILDEGEKLGTIRSIYFEGGEVFLYYPILLHGVRRAREMGYEVGIVSNAYWATSHDDAVAWLRPFADLLSDFSVSEDSYHWDEQYAPLVANARSAALELGLPVDTIAIAVPETANAATAIGQLPPGESAVMYRGRAVEQLVPRAELHPWTGMDRCPYEDLVEPGRVHIDALGYVHICQGIALGNVYEQPLSEIVAGYVPEVHPICGPLLNGGPAELVRRYDLPLSGGYADACHLCDMARRALRHRFPAILAPDQMYGVVDGGLSAA